MHRWGARSHVAQLLCCGVRGTSRRSLRSYEAQPATCYFQVERPVCAPYMLPVLNFAALVTLFSPPFFVSLAKWSQVGWDFKRDQIYKRHNLQSRRAYFQVRTADGEDSSLKVHPTPKMGAGRRGPGEGEGRHCLWRHSISDLSTSDRPRSRKNSIRLPNLQKQNVI